MNFIKYDDIKKFNDDNLDLILEKEWLNNLMVGNCLEGLKIGTEGWLLATITKNNSTELIMLHRKPWNLLLYSPTGNTSDELYKFAAEKIYEINPNLSGVNSETEISNKFAKFYSLISNKATRLNHPMRILLLKELIPGNLIEEAIFRKANKETEYEMLLNYTKEFHKEALNEEKTEEFLKEQLEDYFNKGFYVLEVDGNIVSEAVTARELTKGKMVNQVYTPKEFRGKGYAYNLVYRITEKLLKEGAEYCVLFTDDKNPISNHVYEKIGYKRMADYADINFI